MLVTGYKIGPSANLSKAVLEGADLKGACLNGAILVEANLAGADLRKASLWGACLNRANLSNANLNQADLFGAHLRGADFSRANLSGTCLKGADLGGAYLRGADLSHSCLDPTNEPNGEADEFELDDAGWCVGYRTSVPVLYGNQAYHRGIYKAPFFSTAETECHPGLYLFPRKEEAVHFASSYRKHFDFIRVITPPEEIHRAKNKYRCRWFVVEG